MPTRKTHQPKPKAKEMIVECEVTPRQAAALIQAMGTKTLDEAVQKAVEIATREDETKEKG